MNILVPPHQPIPFPLPLWLIEVLLIVGFVLHLIPMNLAWMGGYLSGSYALGGKSPYARRLSGQLAMALPIVLSFAITQGIVPLLFLQLEYGPLYYTSSVIMAVPWLLVLFVLMAGYYGLYWFKFKHAQMGKLGALLLIAVSGLFTLIAFIFTNNMSLMLTPEKWPGLLQQGLHGNFLFLNSTLALRFFHNALGALAISGIAVGCFGLYYQKRDEEYSRWLISQGSGLFMMTTLLNVIVGFMFLNAQPAPVLTALTKTFTPALITLHSGYLLAGLSLVFAVLSWRNGKAFFFLLTLLTSILTLLDMAVLRHWLRVLSTQSVFHPQLVPVQIQWDLFIAFLILTVGLIVYLTWLVKKAFKAANSQPHLPPSAKEEPPYALS